MTDFKDFLLDEFAKVGPTIERKVWSLEQFTKYMKKRTQLTLEYAKSIEKLQQKSNISLFFEESTAREAYNQMIKTDEEIVKSINYMSQMILDQVVTPLEKLHTEMDSTRKKLFQQGSSLDKHLNESRSALLRIREKYYKTSREIELTEYAIDSSSKKRSELDKLDKKLAKLRNDVEVDKANYQDQIAQSNACQSEFYTKTMPNTMNEIQGLYVQRLEAIKDSTEKYISYLKTQNEDNLEPLLKLEKAFSNISVEDDIQEFIQINSTELSRVPDDYVFEEYIKQGKVDETKKSSWKSKLIGGGSSKTDLNTNYSPYSITKSNESLNSLFGTPLQTLMARQEKTYPDYDIPYFLYFIAENIIRCEGEYTLGIFRLNGSTAKVEDIKQLCSKGDYSHISFTPNQVNDLTSVFKLFFRQLPEPLIPNTLYERCISPEPKDVNSIVNMLPDINKKVLLFLVDFAKRFTDPEIVERTKMTVQNLSAIFAPCIFRCPYTDMTQILQSSEHEKNFFVQMLTSLDTSKAKKVTLKISPDSVDYVKPTEGLLPSERKIISLENKGEIPNKPLPGAVSESNLANLGKPSEPARKMSNPLPPANEVTTSPDKPARKLSNPPAPGRPLPPRSKPPARKPEVHPH